MRVPPCRIWVHVATGHSEIPPNATGVGHLETFWRSGGARALLSRHASLTSPMFLPSAHLPCLPLFLSCMRF